MLVPLRIEVERSRVRHIAARLIRNNGDIVAYLVLIRIALLRIKRNAYRDIRRPCSAGIGAVGIEQLRINVVGSVPRIVPDRVEASIWRD